MSVEISFTCTPATALEHLNRPLDASEQVERRVERVNHALANAPPNRVFWLHDGSYVARFSNSEVRSMVRFHWEGVATSDENSLKVLDLDVEPTLVAETCDGIPPEVETWLTAQVRDAIKSEFERYLAELARAQSDPNAGQENSPTI